MKDRLWIKWVNTNYIKGADIIQVSVPSTPTWMLSRIINGRNLVRDMTHLNSMCVNGDFSLKKAYMERIAFESKPSWSALWCDNRASPRSVICLWQILQDRLPTKAQLLKWGMINDARCVLCQQGMEDRDQLFSGCEFIWKVHHFTSLFFSIPLAFFFF